MLQPTTQTLEMPLQLLSKKKQQEKKTRQITASKRDRIGLPL
jgi:hypothetical protein